MLKVFRLDKHSTEINQVMSLHALWETFSQNWSSIDRLNKTSINLIDCSHGAENLDRFSVAGAEKIRRLCQPENQELGVKVGDYI